MLQGDIGRLWHSEVDFDDGRITRIRNKTEERPTVPEVSWKLWTNTLELLRQERSEHPDLVLTNSVNRALWRDKPGKYDAIGNAWKDIRESSGVDKAFKSLRNTCVTLMDNHSEFARYQQYFLGQAPTGIARTHYVVPSQAKFDECIRWLAGELGVA
jgi:integrase